MPPSALPPPPARTFAPPRADQYLAGGCPLDKAATALYFTLAASAGLSPSPTTNALLPESAEPMTHDLDGNLTSDGRWDYTYDAENRLVSMQTHTALSPSPFPNSDARRLEFAYDSLGRRVQKTVRSGYNGSTFATASTTRFIYDGWNQIAELGWDTSSSTLNLARTFVWGLDWSGTLQGAGGVGGLLLIKDGTTHYQPHYDGNGNLMALTSRGTGALAAVYEYDAFGQTLRESGTYAASNSFRFSTKYADLDTGLIYYGHRYYSPSLGRFINRDPIEESGGLNLYAFCLNNSVNRRDYLGMDPEVTWDDDGIGWTVGINNYNDAGDNWSYYGGRGQAALTAFLSGLTLQGNGIEEFEPIGSPRGMAGLVGAGSHGMPVGGYSSDYQALQSMAGSTLALDMHNRDISYLNLVSGYSVTAGQFISPATGDIVGRTSTTWHSDGQVTSIGFEPVPAIAPWSAPGEVNAGPVAPNNATTTQPATTNSPYWTGTVDYRQGGFILGGGTFSGTVVGPNGQRGTVTGYIVSAGLQIGIYDGSVQATFSGTQSGVSTGTNGGFFSGQVDLGYGPVQIVQAGGNLAAYVGPVNADLGAFTPNNSGPGISTNTSPTDPGGYLDARLGLGGALAFNGFVVTGFTPDP